MDIPVFVVPILIIGVIAIGSLFLQHGNEPIKQWAAKEDYQVLNTSRSWTGGPFWYLVRQGTVYRVVLLGSMGRREAWIFVPYPLAIVQMKVKWIDSRREVSGLPAEQSA